MRTSGLYRLGVPCLRMRSLGPQATPRFLNSLVVSHHEPRPATGPKVTMGGTNSSHCRCRVGQLAYDFASGNSGSGSLQAQGKMNNALSPKLALFRFFIALSTEKMEQQGLWKVCFGAPRSEVNEFSLHVGLSRLLRNGC